MFKRILATVVATGALITVTAAPAQAWHGSTPEGSIVDVAVAASGGGTPDDNRYDYDLLVQAVVATGLDATLADTSTEFTVFAPNDRAFMRLVEDLTGTAPASESEALTTITGAFSAEQITNVLLYHVVAGEALGLVDIILSDSLTMANGGVVEPRWFKIRDENQSFKDPRLVFTAIEIDASNGVIHTIDRVLVPGVI
ncbi:fasciclin domain-containing protein [Agromyces laixinhei]|uniref:fasciclin domain-containing protein n=1 Tax=Agromyces laixinhei TaxID=2585717 RepID=UPI001E6047E1|nr:fasciclin domain-containing protein [Agromyces laixinhei]